MLVVQICSNIMSYLFQQQQFYYDKAWAPHASLSNANNEMQAEPVDP